MTENNCVKFYFQLRLIFAWAFAVLKNHVGMITIVTHLSTIFFLWFGILCWQFVPFFFYFSSLISGIFLIIYDTIIFQKAGGMQTIAELIIRNNRAKYFSRRGNKVGTKYYWYSLWRAQIPVGVPCGSFFVIRKSFAMAYMRELSNNLTSIVLLFQPSGL